MDLKDYEKVMVCFHIQKEHNVLTAAFPCWGPNVLDDGYDCCIGYWEGIDVTGPHNIKVGPGSRHATSTERYHFMRYLKKEVGLNLAIRERAPSLKERKAWVAKGYA